MQFSRAALAARLTSRADKDIRSPDLLRAILPAEFGLCGGGSIVERGRAKSRGPSAILGHRSGDACVVASDAEWSKRVLACPRRNRVAPFVDDSTA